MRNVIVFYMIICGIIGVSILPVYGQLFEPAINYATGDGPAKLFVADLNGDLIKDIAVPNVYSNDVSVIINNGDGTYQNAVNYNVGSVPISVYAADLDGDNDNDLAVVGENNTGVSILMNNGNGTFQNAMNYGVLSIPRAVYSGDFDNDGDNDLAVANTGSDCVSILLNNGNGSFPTTTNYASENDPCSIFGADFDNDNDIDLVVTNIWSQSISVFKGNGNGTFQNSVRYSVNVHPRSVFGADLDNDSDIDLSVTNEGSDNVSILINNGNGIFQIINNYMVGDHPTGIFAVDLDGDLDNDLAVTNSFSDNFSILTNNGDGTFQDAEFIAAGDYPAGIFAADLDGDSDNDLAISNVYSDNVSIFMNLSINIGSILVSVDGEGDLPFQGVIVTVLDQNNDPVTDPIQTNVNGEALFDELLVGVYSVMIVTPLGYSVSPAETQTGISVSGGDCTQVDFVLTPIIVSNNCRTIGYWKHQFNVYTNNRGNAQESETDLANYLDVVYQHFGELDVYIDLENFDFEDAKNILTVRGGSLTLDRTKQQLFALLLNFASGRIGNETVVSTDGRVAAEAVTIVAGLINDSNPANDELAKDICDLINNGQLVGAGVIPESNIRYKQSDNYESLPSNFTLSQNYPNPFNAQTIIEYGLPEPAHVTVQVYDILGRKAAALVDCEQPAGYHQAVWRADKAVSGIYYYKIQANDFTQTEKMLLIK